MAKIWQIDGSQVVLWPEKDIHPWILSKFYLSSAPTTRIESSTAKIGMDSVHYLPGSLAVALTLACCLLLALTLGKARGNLPPGPRGLPLLGNVFQMPTDSPWLTVAAWGKKYGQSFQHFSPNNIPTNPM
jgi:hypothetical protein